MAYLKRSLIVLVVLVIFLALFNWQYFKVQFNFYLNTPDPQVVDVAIGEPDLLVSPDRLWIESLKIEAPVVYVGTENENDFQAGLQNGVVRYPKTALPGQPGNVYIFGHSSDSPLAKGNYKTVFALLPKIPIGSAIKISDSAGKLYTYLVDRKFVTSKSDLTVLEQDYSKKQLSLQTSYPVGTALRRYIVVAYLVE